MLEVSEVMKKNRSNFQYASLEKINFQQNSNICMINLESKKKVMNKK